MRLKFQHQCHTHYHPAGNGDVLDIALQKNVRLSEVIVSDILDSDHLPTVFYLLDQLGIFRTRLTIYRLEAVSKRGF
jgi:hypothetical protein